MSATAAPFDIGSFIESDPDWHDGWPYINCRHVTVAGLAMMHAHGETPEEIAFNESLSLAEVHAALAYYFANRAAIDAAIDAYDAETDRIMQAWPDAPAER